MAYEEKDAERIREILGAREDVVEKRMFGGLAFMVRGHMCVGLTDDALMVRTGPSRHEEALARAHARAMDFTGKPMKGFVFVEPAGWSTSKSLRSWVELGLSFVETQPPK